MDLRLPAALLFTALLMPFGTSRAQSCVSDNECQDGSWCNGTERCEGNPGYAQCMPAKRPMCPSKKICDDIGQRCLTPAKAEKLLTPCPEGQTYSATENQCVAKPPG
jgi:hypothetical protein